MKLYKSTKEKEVFYYFNAKEEKLWLFRHKYYDGVTGKRKEKKKSGFKTEKAAIQALLEVKAQTLRGETKSIENDNLSVGEWLDIWYEMNLAKWKKPTAIQRKNVIRLHLKPLIGHIKLSKLERGIYQKLFINALQTKLNFQVGTIKLYHNIFKVAINSAVEEGILSRNKISKAIIAEDDKGNNNELENYLDPAELMKLLNTAKETESITSYTFLLLGAYSGVRKGESCGLQWKNIDFEKNTITIERTRDEKGVRTPKTKNSYRTILVDPLVMQQLKQYKTWCKQLMLSYGKTLKDDSFVFISEFSGEFVAPTSLNIMMRRVQATAGLVTEDDEPRITIHGLRHTHATILLNQGATVNLIAKRLGNTPAMIYDVYGHVLKEMETESVAVFSSSLKAIGAKSGADF